MEMKNNFKLPTELDQNSLHQKRISMLIVIGVVLIVILGVFVIRYAISIRPQPSESAIARVPTPTITARSEMWLDPPSTIVPVGRQFTVKVMLDAHNTVISGADALVNFDPQYLDVVSIEKPNEPNSVFEMFGRQTENQIQITSTKLSGDNSRTPQMTLAVITFLTKKIGSTTLTLDFMRGSTAHSTIINARNSENILDVVQGTDVAIQ